VTADIRVIYSRYCPSCDAGEPIVAKRTHTSISFVQDPDAFWAASAPAPAAATATATRPSDGRPRGLELWWNGDSPSSENGDDREAPRTDRDERWAAFASKDFDFDNDSDDGVDEVPPPAEGSFSFGTEDIGKRRRLRFARPLRLRQRQPNISEPSGSVAVRVAP
jgi:hypothetical protein